MPCMLRFALGRHYEPLFEGSETVGPASIRAYLYQGVASMKMTKISKETIQCVGE